MSTDTETMMYKRADIEGNLLGDEIVFFDDRVGKYFATGTVGADIWKLIERPCGLESIVGRLVEIYDVDVDLCRAQTKNFMDQMVSLQLIELVVSDL